MALSKYKIFCITEDKGVISKFVDTAITTCPNNVAHTVNLDSVRVAKTVGQPEFHINFAAGRTTNDTTWDTVARVIYRGSNDAGPWTTVMFLSRIDSGGSHDIRIRNVGAGETIAARSGLTNTDAHISVDTTVNNLPKNKKDFEIQMRVSNAAYQARLYEVVFTY